MVNARKFGHAEQHQENSNFMNQFRFFLGAFICSQFILSSCTEAVSDTFDVKRVCESCKSTLQISETISFDAGSSVNLSIPDSLGAVNTNIPIKIFGDNAYLITKQNWIVFFNVALFDKTANSSAIPYQKLPDEYCNGLADYYINSPNETWLITRKDKNFLFSYNHEKKLVDTLLIGDEYIWNAYPFLGATVVKGEQNQFYLPFVKGNQSGKTALISAFEKSNNRLNYQHEIGELVSSNSKGWEPYSHTPYFAAFTKNAFWVSSSVSQGVVHYQLKNGKLTQDDFVCFPEAKFTKNLDPVLLNDQDLVNRMYVENSYNLGLNASSTHLLKYVKEKQPYIDPISHLKHSINDSPWYIDVYSFERSTLRRINIPEKRTYFTLTFIRENRLYLASQHTNGNSISFYKITL